jgi:hypothetical protein
MWASRGCLGRVILVALRLLDVHERRALHKVAARGVLGASYVVNALK